MATKKRGGRPAGRKLTSALSILLTPEEHDMVRELAEAEGLSVAAMVRQFIRRAHKQLTRDAKA